MKRLTTLLFLLMCNVILFSSCKKDLGENKSGQPEIESRAQNIHGHLKQTKTYSSDVVKMWLTVQTSMLYRQSGNPFGLNPGRYMAYTGVALYEAIVPGMPAYQSLQGQLTAMPSMPTKVPGVGYHWPSSAHAALATMFYWNSNAKQT